MPADFNDVAARALSTMERHARQLGVKGVAVFIMIEDGSNTWDCKLRVVDAMKRGSNDPGNPKDVGANFAAIAFSKAAEMADTLEDSGIRKREPIKGELGARGGVIRRYESGYVLAAFSGGAGDQDAEISRAGLDTLVSDT